MRSSSVGERRQAPNKGTEMDYEVGCTKYFIFCGSAISHLYALKLSISSLYDS